MAGYPFELKMYVFTRPNLRDAGLDMERFLGGGVLNSIFDKMEQRPDVTDLFLSFPESRLNILEQRALFPRLARYCPNLKEVTVKTHSVYIVQCVDAKNIGIVDSAGDIPEEGPDDRKLYHEDPPCKLIDLNGLTVFGKDGVTIVNKSSGGGLRRPPWSEREADLGKRVIQAVASGITNARDIRDHLKIVEEQEEAFFARMVCHDRDTHWTVSEDLDLELTETGRKFLA